MRREWEPEDLVASWINVQPELEAVGSPREQVEQLLTHLTQVMAGSQLAACVPALIEAAERDATVRDLYHRYSTQRRQPLRDAIARGISQGTFPAHVAPDLAAQALAGTIFYRRLLTHTPFTPQEVPQLVMTVLGPRRR
ncbi:MAG: TetR/AcrR family transcriptional regulator C-terminal ligand-binding domain-containing protein [Actinomycetota bacterium]|nr:TetR/AcrR family transcriptional regulator C-terminal ligand-binding domain-containing protein [Actinomycetota bacterium]